jgi:AcrR family transcriptional regulator
MRLSAPDRRERLLTAATELFSHQGFEGTTTRQIAHAAGVSEAIVFRHFRSKEDMYWAVLDAQCISRGATTRVEQYLKEAGDGDEKVFLRIGEDILRRNSEDSQLSRLALFSALENHKLSHRFFRTYISEYYEAVAACIRERIRRKQFRRVDPLLAARGFIGMFYYHFLIQELFGGKQVQTFDPAKVSRTLTSVWLDGMANGNGHHSPSKKKVRHS